MIGAATVPSCRCRWAPARWRSPGSPPPASGPGSSVRSLAIVTIASNGGPNGGNARLRRPVLPLHRPGHRRPAGHRGVARHHHPHHPCAGHEHAPRAVVHLVGAGVVARPCWSPCRCSSAICSCLFVGHKYPSRQRAQRQPRHPATGRPSASPSPPPSSSPSRCSASSPTPWPPPPGARLAPARHHLRRHRPRRHGHVRRRRAEPGDHPRRLPRPVGRRQALRPAALRASSTCCRCSVRSSPWSLTASALRQAGRRSAPRSCSRCSVRCWRLLGLAASALHHIGDAGLVGTVFEEGAWLALVYAAVLAGHGRRRLLGPEVVGPHDAAEGRRCRSHCSASLGAALASVPLLIAGFADQPGGIFPAVEPGVDGVVKFDYSGPSELWNTLSAVGHVLVLLAVLAFVGLALRSFTKGEHAGDDPWDGQTLEWATTSPAPGRQLRRRAHRARRPSPCSTSSPRTGVTPDACSSPGSRPGTRAGRSSSAPRSPSPVPPRSSAACWRCSCGCATTPSSAVDGVWVPEGRQDLDGRRQRDAARAPPHLRLRPVGGVLRQARRQAAHGAGARPHRPHRHRLHQRPGVHLRHHRHCR